MDKYKGDCEVCKWDCSRGKDHPRWHTGFDTDKEGECILWEPSAILSQLNEAVVRLKVHCKLCFIHGGEVCPCDHSKVKCGTIKLLNAIEGGK